MAPAPRPFVANNICSDFRSSKSSERSQKFKITQERKAVLGSRPIFLAAPALEPLFEITALTLVHTKEMKGRQTSGVVLSRPIFLAAPAPREIFRF